MLTGALSELRFRPRGGGRFFGAGFLVVWLCGWVLGEAFALYLLFTGLAALLTGNPPPGKNQPLASGPAFAVSGFLLIWLTFWTIGGIAAIRELLRMLWAEDRIGIQTDGLALTRWLGPFVRRRHLARHEIRQVYLQPAQPELMAQVRNKLVTLTTLGTPAERTAAVATLRAALNLPAEQGRAGVLPEGWRETNELRGGMVVTADPQTRRQQAHVVAVLTGVVWSGVLLLIRGSLREPTLWVLTVMVGVLGLWLIRQSLWMYRGRKEWRIDHGRLVHQRRYAEEVTELAEARALELTETTDSDSDRWYTLAASVTGKPITILKTIHDPTAPRNLGLWLSQRAAIPFQDKVPTEAARQADLNQLLDALENTGKFGRWLSRKFASKDRR